MRRRWTLLQRRFSRTCVYLGRIVIGVEPLNNQRWSSEHEVCLMVILIFVATTDALRVWYNILMLNNTVVTMMNVVEYYIVISRRMIRWCDTLLCCEQLCSGFDNNQNCQFLLLLFVSDWRWRHAISRPLWCGSAQNQLLIVTIPRQRRVEYADRITPFLRSVLLIKLKLLQLRQSCDKRCRIGRYLQ